MTRTVDLDQTTALVATGVFGFPQSEGRGTITKVPTRGHFHWSLTTVSTGTATVVLKGTNNPDPNDASGETLITNTHGAANQQDGSAANKGYKYVFANATALGGGSTVSRVLLLGTGFAGTH